MRLCFALLLFVAISAPALAAPVNDSWANRTVIGALPYVGNEPTFGTATVGAGDPFVLCRGGAETQGGNTLWYSYTTGANVEYLTLSTAGSTGGVDTMLSVYTGSPGAFDLVAGACSDDAAAATSRIAGLRLAPNTAYSIEAAKFSPSGAVTNLALSVSASQVLHVNSVDDTSPSLCDDICTLREAISAANQDPTQGYAILLPAGTYRLDLVGANDDLNATGDLDVRESMGIYGAGAGATIIDAIGQDRALHIDPASNNRVTAILGDLAIRNGNVAGNGGGVLAPSNVDFVALERVEVVQNHSGNGGGGLQSAGYAQLLESTFKSNSSNAGGGMSFIGSASTLKELRGTTVSGNTAAVDGGGIHSYTSLRIANSTISGNAAVRDGGGLYAALGGPVALSNVTIARNTADADANSGGTGGGVSFGSTAAHMVINSVIADNIDNNVAPAPDCAKSGPGTLVTSYSLLEATAGGCVFAGAGDLSGVDPAMAPLADNGGPTWTHAIGPGASSARDAGDPGGCRDVRGQPFSSDQRGVGFARLYNAICDKGAYEYQLVDDVFKNGFE